MEDDDPFRDIPGTMTIEIDPPIIFKGQEYSQLMLREPKAGEVRQADEIVKGNATMASLRNREHHLIAKVSDVPVPVIEMCPVSRLTLAMEYLSRFLVTGRRTGEN